MADLTDADKKSFIDKMIGFLKENKAALVAEDWDPAQRTINLENGVKSVTGDEGIVSSLEAALSAAVAARRSDLDNNYDLASASVGSVEGALGKDSVLVKNLRKIRGAMNQTAKPAKPAN